MLDEVDSTSTSTTTGRSTSRTTTTTTDRFRINLFMARGKPSLAARLITSNIKKFEELYLPQILGEISDGAQGLILFAGVTGSGKSTSIASMLQYVNERKRVHIVTIEDPIEYIFKDAKATINQREVGIDCLNFNEALRALVRENPDVVLVGEMRDHETFEAAIRAAETGHLVFGTIHASSAWQTFGRIYDLFPRPSATRSASSSGTTCGRSSTRSSCRRCTRTSRGSRRSRSSSTPRASRSTSSRAAKASCWTSSSAATRRGCIDFTTSLVRARRGRVHPPQGRIEATPKPEELKMRLKGISVARPIGCRLVSRAGGSA